MMRYPACAVLPLLMIGAMLGLARAGDDAIIDRWYEALLAADRAALSSLLADNAEVVLEDLGVTQTKAEFLASMDEWQQAAAGASIDYRIESRDGAMTTVLACYDFPDNDVLIRESFVVEGGVIAENRQIAVAQSCDAEPPAE